MIRRRHSFLGALAGAAILAAPASAQLARQSDAPVDYTGDVAAWENDACRATVTGAAELLQADARLRAQRMLLYRNKVASGGSHSCVGLARVEAHGEVFYVTPRARIRGQDAVYEKATDLLIFTGDVVAVQGKNVLRGDRLTMKVATGDMRMESTRPDRRARGVFYPNGDPLAEPGRQATGR